MIIPIVRLDRRYAVHILICSTFEHFLKQFILENLQRKYMIFTKNIERDFKILYSLKSPFSKRVLENH